MPYLHKKRRTIVTILALFLFAGIVIFNTPNQSSINTSQPDNSQVTSSPAIDALKTLEVKGRAPKTDYSREQFGADWAKINGCDTQYYLKSGFVECNR